LYQSLENKNKEYNWKL